MPALKHPWKRKHGDATARGDADGKLRIPFSAFARGKIHQQLRLYNLIQLFYSASSGK